MNHRLSRLKTAIKPQQPGPSSGSSNNNHSLPPYNNNGNNNEQQLSMAEKTLPPGAAGYNHRQTQWDQAQKERDELERAMRLSEEESQYEAALRASQEAEEQAKLRQSAELEAEQEILKQSRKEQEELEDKLAIAQAEEEQAILKAIRESEKESHHNNKGKQREDKDGEGRTSSINTSTTTHAENSIDERNTFNSGTQRQQQKTSSTSATGGGEDVDDDDDLRKAMELSIREQERERHEQEELLLQAQRRREHFGANSLSTPTSPSSSSSHHHATGAAPRPLSMTFTVTNPSSSPSSSSSSSSPASPMITSPASTSTTHASLLSRPVPPPPTRMPRRQLSIEDEIQSVSDAPPAYEPRSPDSIPKKSTPAASPSTSGSAAAAAVPPERSDSSLTQAASEMTSSSQAQADARALEEKRLIFYPPVADNEMAEGSMRAFVPHMLFAARARERSDPDEYLPITSRDVDLRQLAQDHRQSLSSTNQPQPPQSPNGPSPGRARRPLPPLPVDVQNAHAQPSALSQLDQKTSDVASTSSPSYVSHRTISPTLGHGTMTASPSIYDTAQSFPSHITSQSGGPSISSTTRAVENEDYDDPFDDSRAASLTDDEGRRSYGSGSDTADEDYYNDHPSHTINATGEDYDRDLNNTSDEDTSGQQSHPTNASHTISSRTTDTDHSQEEDLSASTQPPASSTHVNTDTPEADTSAATAPVGRYDYAGPVRADARAGSGHLPRAASAEPQEIRNKVRDEQLGLAAGEGYMSGDSAVSWESTGSETEYQTAATSSTIHESAQDINTNISFGFNPLSSPNKYLDWQGRFPDLIVLSRFADDNNATTTSASSSSATENTKEDYRTFAFEAPTWRELLAYLMWHGNSMFEAAARDKQSSQAGSLRVSLILEFVKTTAPPSTLVRLQIHLLSTSTADGAGSVPASRGVALSRQPLSSRPTNYVNSSLPWTQGSKGESTHLVLAFPKPYHSLPFNLGTIGTHLHNAHKAAVVQQSQQAHADHRIQLGDKNRINNTQFLTDLIRGIDMCTDHTSDQRPGKNSSYDDTSRRGGAGNGGHVTPDDSRFDKLVNRLREKRQSMRGTLREMHKNTRRRRRHRKLAKDNKGKGRADDRGSDSDQSYLQSQPQAEDYHITPFPATT